MGNPRELNGVKSEGHVASGILPDVEGGLSEETPNIEHPTSNTEVTAFGLGVFNSMFDVGCSVFDVPALTEPILAHSLASRVLSGHVNPAGLEAAALRQAGMPGRY